MERIIRLSAILLENIFCTYEFPIYIFQDKKSVWDLIIFFIICPIFDKKEKV